MSEILPISVFGILLYTCDIGLSVGRYFCITNRLTVLPIFARDICYTDISIWKLTLYCLILCITVLVAADIALFFKKIPVLVIYAIPIFGKYCNLKTLDINITNIEMFAYVTVAFFFRWAVFQETQRYQ